MKRILPLLLLFSLFLFSCSNEASVPASKGFSKGMEYLGEVNAVYDASKLRYGTGQTIYNYEGNKAVVFIGQLTEYNSFTSQFADYIETVVKDNNALIHQNYPVRYNPNKKYVEFSAYVNKETGEIVEYEIRVFNGDFTKNEGGWYAKTCKFNNTFTKDLTNKRDVNFGLKFTPEKIPVELLPDNGKSTTISNNNKYSKAFSRDLIDADFLKIIDKIGKAENIYMETTDLQENKNGDLYRAAIVEYKEVEPILTEKLDNKFEAKKNEYDSITKGVGLIDPNNIRDGYTYINVIQYLDKESKELKSINIRRINIDKYKENLKNSSEKIYYATSIEFDSMDDILDSPTTH